MAATKSMVCFSFAAYSKALVARLRASGLPVAAGLSDAEFASAESLFGFAFPPDLRAILREGLPVAAGFPDWRSSSPQQLHVLVSLSVLQIIKQVSLGRFWLQSWGQKPVQRDLAVETAKRFLRKCPVLVPIFRNCYVPAGGQAGHPVFYVDSDGVRVLSFDIGGFFREFEFLRGGRLRPAIAPAGVGAPAWAATAARWVEFWSEAAAERRRRWWVAAARGEWRGGGLGACMEAVVWRLRAGGWGEEEVREMMMMDLTDSSDSSEDRRMGTHPGIGCGTGEEAEGVTWRVRMLSLVLLRAGWTTEDVVYSLGLDHRRNDDLDCVVLDGDYLLRCC